MRARHSSRSNRAGSVSARKSSSTAMKRPGCSTWGRWPTRPGEGAVAAGDLGDVGGGLHSDLREAAPDDAADLLPGAGGGGDEELGAGQGGGAKHRAHLEPEPPAGDEDQALDQLGELVG